MSDTAAVTSPAWSAEAARKTVLHVGAGADRRTLHWSFQGWRHLTLDADPACNPDVVGSITDMAAVLDAEAEAVYAAHVLEHVGDHEVPLALAEFLRVLKPDGDVLIQVPDLRQACAAIAAGRGEQPLYQSPAGPVCPLDMVYGFRGFTAANPLMAHKTGFTMARLERLLGEAGFVEVKTWVEGYDLFATGHKP